MDGRLIEKGRRSILPVHPVLLGAHPSLCSLEGPWGHEVPEDRAGQGAQPGPGHPAKTETQERQHVNEEHHFVKLK